MDRSRLPVHVKICGLTNLEDACCAAEAGANMLGFIFTTKSPRYIDRQRARDIIDRLVPALSAKGIALPKLVGVFVDAVLDEVSLTMETVGLDYAQLHGTEPTGMLAELRCRGYKAMRPRPGQEDPKAVDPVEFAALGVPDGPRLLVDAYSSIAHGGTGELADWSYAAALAAQIQGFMLAGGLTPENVVAAIHAVQPWAVDTSSGVEAEPGRKDHDALRRFVKAAKTAGA